MQTLAKTAALALHSAADLRKPQFPTDEEKAQYRELDAVRASILDDDWPKKVMAFRKLYSLARFNAAQPGHLALARHQLQREMLGEEFQETVEASHLNDIPDVIDGCLDLIYVALGYLAELGLTSTQVNLLMEEVHASNLTKVDERGQPIYGPTGKVLKGEHYQKADIRALLLSFGWTIPEAWPSESVTGAEQSYG